MAKGEEMKNESWKKAATALVQHWKTNGPQVSAQWCSDAAKLLELAQELMAVECEPRPSQEFEVASDPNLQAQFRMRRHPAKG